MTTHRIDMQVGRPRMGAWRAIGMAVLMLAAPGGASAADAVPATRLPAVAAPCCGPITADGRTLGTFLDESGVETLWLPGWHVDWKTGRPDRDAPGGHGSRSHCSAFAAAMAERLGIYLLRPPEHGQILLANAQRRWLDGPDAAADGWLPVEGDRAAVAAANQGFLVVAVVANPNPRKAGHIAIVRPSLKPAAALATEGPDIVQAGSRNLLNGTVARVFRNHAGAWQPGGGGTLAYFAHAVNWDAGSARATSPGTTASGKITTP